MRPTLHITTFACCLFLSFNSKGQQAIFETSIFFQDAAGNRDTIIIGADTTANELVNPHLGEFLLTEPWKNRFEVRVTKWDQYQDHFWFGDPLYQYNKRIVDLPYVPDCGYTPSVVFLIHTNYFPVTVTWDTVLWSIDNNECLMNGSFFHHSHEILEPGWWGHGNEISYSCLGLNESYNFDTLDPDYYTGFIDSVSGVGMEFIYGLQLKSHEIFNFLSPCQYVVNVSDPVNNYVDLFNIYPNPSTGYLSIELLDESKISRSAFLSIRNYQGIEVMKIKNLADNHYSINIESLPDGIYFASVIEPEQHSVMTQIFVVIN
ncbi:MAG: T9SS type A sorting domain-containing protein [Saprospiraceae bacterium]